MNGCDSCLGLQVGLLRSFVVFGGRQCQLGHGRDVRFPIGDEFIMIVRGRLYGLFRSYDYERIGTFHTLVVLGRGTRSVLIYGYVFSGVFVRTISRCFFNYVFLFNVFDGS